jgi:hypothetical protein
MALRPSPNVEILEENGTIYAVILGADYTSEHEHGIGDLLPIFGISDRADAVGVEARSMDLSKTHPDYVAFFGYQKTEEIEERSATRVTKHPKQVTRVRAMLAADNLNLDFAKRQLRRRYKPHEDFLAAWDAKSFILAGFTDRAKAFVTRLERAVKEGDLALWIGGRTGNPFSRGGIVLSIPSLVPQSEKDVVEEADRTRIAKEAAEKEDAVKIAAAAKATGIEDRLKAATRGNHFSPYRLHAIVPGWTANFHPGRELKTIHPVVFFINPGSAANHGWFTVEELDQWIDGTGPVCKQPKSA